LDGFSDPPISCFPPGAHARVERIIAPGAPRDGRGGGRGNRRRAVVKIEGGRVCPFVGTAAFNFRTWWTG